MRRLTATVVLCMLLASPAAAQAPAAAPAKTVATVDEVTRELIILARRTIDKLGPSVVEPFSGTVTSSAGGPILTFLAGQIANREAYKTLTDLLAVSSATQVGSTSDTGGSTSVAMKGLVPTILGFAVEHGAIAQDVNDTIVTFRVNPAGLVKGLQGEGLLDIYADYSSQQWYRTSSRFSASVSFDTSLGDSPGTLLANEQQLTAWSVTALLLNHRDPRTKGYAAEWRKLANEQSESLVKARVALDRALLNWATFTDWQKALTDRVRSEVDARWSKDHDTQAATVAFKAILDSELPALTELSKPDPSVRTAMSAYVAELTTVVQARNDIYDFANRGAIATFDWTTTRDETLPDLFTLTGVYENSFTRSRKDDFTANVAVRFYRESPAGAERQFKDFSLSRTSVSARSGIVRSAECSRSHSS